jgi:NTE family protein
MTEIAIALGGGGIRGIAHIGALQRLEEEGYQIRAIAGTSAGGIVGAVYAAGYSPSEICELIKNADHNNLFLRNPNDGPSLLGLKGLSEILMKAVGNRQFEDLNIPFACTAVDIVSSQEVVLSQGYVIEALLATSAFPGIFPPQEIGDTILVDGGVLDPVPVALAHYLRPDLPVVAICLSPSAEGWSQINPLKMPEKSPIPRPLLEQFARLRLTQAFNIFAKSMDITSRMMTELRLNIDQPDVLIRPDVIRFGLIDDVDPNELVKIGDEAVKDAMDEIRQSFSLKSTITRRFKKRYLPGKVLPIENGFDES